MVFLKFYKFTLKKLNNFASIFRSILPLFLTSPPKHYTMSVAKQFIHFDVIPKHSEPIIFKKIDQEQFKERGYDVIHETIVPDSNGYASNQIAEKITPETNTLVFNCGVGQGKTTGVFEIIKRIAQKDQYVIIVALPFRSLIEKYTIKSISLAGAENVSSYSDFDEILEGDTWRVEGRLIDEFQKTLPIRASKKIHIITVNGLLGNPGEAVQQAKLKREFFSKIRDHCNHTEKKVVFIFDEIHETVHNFKDEYIFTLRLWKSITHKAVILTATYTEASLIAIMHIAYLTEKKIKIIESERLKVPKDRVANLYLYFTKEAYSSKKIEEFDYIKDLIKDEKYKNINILSFSERLAESLSQDPMFADKNVNVATSKGSPFNPDSINIGTTFKTGIDILDKHSLFIIILPGINFQNHASYGIFSDGIPSIIQSIARLRNGGDIYIFMPFPKVFIKGSILQELKKLFTEYEEYELRKPEEEGKVIGDKYKQIRKELEDEILIADLEQKNEEKYPIPRYPSMDSFILEKSQSYLVNIDPSFGKLIYPYVIWAATNNQFTNCILKSIYTHNYQEISLNLTKGNYFMEILQFMEDYGTLDSITDNFDQDNDFKNFNTILNVLRNASVNDGSKARVKIIIDGKVKQLDKLTLVQQEVLSILSYLKFENKEVVSKQSYINQNCFLSENQDSNLAKGYQILESIRKEFIDKIQQNDDKIIFAKDTNNNIQFITDRTEALFKSAIKYISQDYFFKNRIFNLQVIGRQNKESIYKFLIDSFLTIKNSTKRKVSGKQQNCLIVEPYNPPINKLKLLKQDI